MDVFKVGAGSPKAPESSGVLKNDAVSRHAGGARPAEGAGDGFSESSDAASVVKFVDKLKTSSDTREDTVRRFRELLGRGLLDSQADHERAAAGLIGS